jgi:hypothetical protein
MSFLHWCVIAQAGTWSHYANKLFYDLLPFLPGCSANRNAVSPTTPSCLEFDLGNTCNPWKAIGHSANTLWFGGLQPWFPCEPMSTQRLNHTPTTALPSQHQNLMKDVESIFCVAQNSRSENFKAKLFGRCNMIHICRWLPVLCLAC